MRLADERAAARTARREAKLKEEEDGNLICRDFRPFAKIDGTEASSAPKTGHIQAGRWDVNILGI